MKLFTHLIINTIIKYYALSKLKKYLKKNFRLNIFKIYYDIVFIIILLGNLYNYMKVLYNSIICILDYLFQNIIRQVLYYYNTLKIIRKP